MNKHRRLWTAVLCQAYADLEAEPLDSSTHLAAVAWFFGSSREQRDARVFVADACGLAPHALRKAATTILNRRREAAGLALVSLERPPPSPEPLPRLEAIYMPPEPRRHAGGRLRHDRGVFDNRRHVFDPWAPLPSERERMS